MRSCQEPRWCFVDYPVSTYGHDAPASDLILSIGLDVVHGIWHVAWGELSPVQPRHLCRQRGARDSRSQRRAELDPIYRDLPRS